MSAFIPGQCCEACGWVMVTEGSACPGCVTLEYEARKDCAAEHEEAREAHASALWHKRKRQLVWSFIIAGEVEREWSRVMDLDDWSNPNRFDLMGEAVRLTEEAERNLRRHLSGERKEDL